jgi:hypothetical protein
MRKAAFNRGPRKPFNHTAEAKLKIGAGNYQVQSVILKNNETGVSTEFSTLGKAA